MTAPAFRRNTVVLLLVASIAALIVRTVLQLWLERRGLARQVAGDLAYLAVPPVMLLLTVPIWRDAGTYIASLYRRADFSFRVLVTAVAIGALMRTVWWSTTFARVSFGWFTTPGTEHSAGPAFAWQCPAPTLLALGIVVMAVMVPIVEEIVHRGYLYRIVLRWGAPTAVIVSALLFMVFHKFGSWSTAFMAGIVFAIQFHRTGSLWSSTISHATFNFLVQLDWRCLNGQWNPTEQQQPVLGVGLISLAVLVASGLLIACLLQQQTPGAREHPGRD